MMLEDSKGMAFFWLLFMFCFKEVAALSCGDPGKLLFGKRTITHFDTGGIVRYECNECYELKGPKIVQCNDWGYWTSNAPKCVRGKCPILRLQKGKTLSARETGYVYHFFCHDGLVLDGPDKVECMCDGKWHSKAPKCVAATATTTTTTTTTPPQPPVVMKTVAPKSLCAAPERKLVNGYLYFVNQNPKSGQFIPGDRVYYFCYPRYQLIGPNTRVCQPNFEWTYYHPTCLIKSCVKLAAPVNSEMFGSNRRGSSLEFHCDIGYKLEGDKVIRCLNNGKWNKKPPKCVPACKGVECPIGRLCKYDYLSMQAKCECASSLDCPSVYNPICASDAVTYNNDCLMMAAACRGNSTKIKVADRPCKLARTCRIIPLSRCKGRFAIFYFDKQLGGCKQRDVGGCHKSGWNGYPTLTECEQDCKDMCKKKADLGPCRSARLRWAYLESIDDCQKFIYGGCFGNSNNFETYKECKEFCVKSEKSN